MIEVDPEIIKANQKEIINKLKAAIEQNYFHFNQQCYNHTEGLAVGALTSAILAKVYIQYMEHKQLYPVLMNHEIIGYFRYIDEILIIYNQNKTIIDGTLTEFSKQRTNIKFSVKK
jgi:ribosomal protein S17E